MLRIFRSLLLGLLLGALVGLYFGWVQFPADSRSSALSDLAKRHRDDYIVMVAAGYAADDDLAGALERLRRLEIDDLGPYLRETTEAIIRSSARDLNDIRFLVALSAGLGQLTAPMEPFLDLSGARA